LKGDLGLRRLDERRLRFGVLAVRRGRPSPSGRRMPIKRDHFAEMQKRERGVAVRWWRNPEKI
jgi:hypothetical protein